MRTEGLAQAYNTVSGISGIHLLKYPTGRFGFCGRVPVSLSVVNADGTPVSDVVAEKYAHDRHYAGDRVALQSNGLKRRTWETSDAAMADAAAEGYTAV